MTTKDESSTRATLAGLGREVYVSQRGLEHVVKELKDKNLLVGDAPSSRSPVKRAREEDFQSCSNRYGALAQELQLPMENAPKKIRTIPFVHPAALMQHMCSHQQFAGFLTQKMGLAVCKHDVPWKLIVYSDEVTPGNALKTKNLRKVQCVYWSLQQLGHRALASESLWFPVVAIRSQICAEIGGMTVLWKHILELVFFRPRLASRLVLEHTLRQRDHLCQVGDRGGRRTGFEADGGKQARFRSGFLHALFQHRKA